MPRVSHPYNHSEEYVAAVLRDEQAYRLGHYDGDGVLEEYVAELAGLVDRTVVVVFDDLETGPVVVAIADLPFLLPVAVSDDEDATAP